MDKQEIKLCKDCQNYEEVKVYEAHGRVIKKYCKIREHKKIDPVSGCSLTLKTLCKDEREGDFSITLGKGLYPSDLANYPKYTCGFVGRNFQEVENNE